MVADRYPNTLRSPSSTPSSPCWWCGYAHSIGTIPCQGERRACCAACRAVMPTELRMQWRPAPEPRPLPEPPEPNPYY